MLTYVAGDLFTSPAQVLTNTINTVGVMGKGIAKEFKRIYPDMFLKYRDLCEHHQLDIGNLWLYRTQNKWILNFPTKKHWRAPSKLEYIEAGLKKFILNYSRLRIDSIAFPALGCGNGELDFESQVKPIMEKYLRKLPINVFIYLPIGQERLLPEHKRPQEIKDWLNSEAESISFNEVWDDLRNILSKPREFKTFANNSQYNAKLDELLMQIIIETKNNKRYAFSYDNLLGIWQQLRRYGFSLRRIVPNGLERYIGYLVPILAELKYIQPIKLAEKYENLQNNPSIGLQYIPRKYVGSKEATLL
jgi:O-acetyl-ADP-ribose deacetylase (regulator of RNase III)